MQLQNAKHCMSAAVCVTLVQNCVVCSRSGSLLFLTAANVLLLQVQNGTLLQQGVPGGSVATAQSGVQSTQVRPAAAAAVISENTLGARCAPHYWPGSKSAAHVVSCSTSELAYISGRCHKRLNYKAEHVSCCLQKNPCVEALPANRRCFLGLKCVRA
jgi:hypothetical protein